jgi:hypothetical protein
MAVLGLGLGFVMQVLVLAVQNAVDYARLGVATSTATLFRSLGATIGVPLFGAIFSNKLASSLGGRLPPEVLARLPARIGPSQIDALPPAIREPYVAAWAAALRPIFLLAAGIAVLGFVLSWFLQERPLRETVADQGLGDSFAAPRDATSLDELEIRLSTLARKQNRHLVYKRLTERAGLELSAPAAWLLLRLAEGEAGSDGALADRLGLGRHETEGMLAELRAAALAAPDVPRLTPSGRDAADKLTQARRDGIQAILVDWQPSEQPEVRNLVETFAHALGSAPPASEGAR